MKFISTRDKNARISGSLGIIKGLSDEGGLFVPEFFPKVSLEEIKELSNLPYFKLSAKILKLFLDEYSLDELEGITGKAYKKFEGEPAPVVKAEVLISQAEGLDKQNRGLEQEGRRTSCCKAGEHFLELWHGPTHAFKDIALTVLPELLVRAKEKNDKFTKTLILAATSGDTGKAALEGFKDVSGTSIVVLYPESGVSRLQKLQMITQRGGNVKVIGIKGNFDDAQKLVKHIFENCGSEFYACGVELSSANSINIGRLLPQIAYYFSSYASLLSSGQIKLGDKISFSVPSGNFGNILAGYYAYKMGLPINKLICASNKNNVLTDFFLTGAYDINRDFYSTISPSMDILISSNFERLLFELSDRDDKLTAERMTALKTNGHFSVSIGEKARAADIFTAGFCSEEECSRTISDCFKENNYLIDTHTAVGLKVCKEHKADGIPTVVVSTASPVKFVDDILIALNETTENSPFDSLVKLSKITGISLPLSVTELSRLPVIHNKIVEKEEVLEEIFQFIK